MTQQYHSRKLEGIRRFCQQPWIPLVLGLVATLATLLLWSHFLPQVSASSTLLSRVLLAFSLGFVWTLALAIALGQQTKRQALQVRLINQQLQTEIIHRQQVEASLRAQIASQALLRSQTLFNTFIDGVVVMNPRGEVLQANSSFARMLGYSLEEILTLRVFDWDVGWSRAELEVMLFGEVVVPLVETRHRRKDGSQYDVEISWNRVELDNELLNFCICRDISERKRIEAERKSAEVALAASQQRYQNLIENSPDIIERFDLQLRHLYVSPALTRITGIPTTAFLGKTCQDLGMDAAMVQTWKAAAAALLSTGQKQVIEFAVPTLEGVRSFEMAIAPELSDQQQIESILCISRDITERKQVEAALRQAMEAAEAANLAKSVFLANMSHELRTPLNVILGFTQVMAHDTSLAPHHQEDLKTIRRSGDYLLNLINDVLDLSKIEAGHSTLLETGFDLIALLHTLRSMMTERAKAKQLQLEFEIDPEVPQYVIADEQKLRQILLNLLSNAIKFTHQGQVRLRVKPQQSSDLLATSARLPLQFEITDTGVGIATHEQTIIFDAFIQAEAGKKLISGTGLGLTISRKLLELMQGEIVVQSSPGLGSTFTFTVPMQPTNSLDIRPEQQHRLVLGLLPGQPHRRILVVDDQLENRLLLTRLLAQLGLEIRQATNGLEAIQIWQEWHPDLTWMDIWMPDLDGYEATRQIRALEQDQASIIIALTAQASQSDRALALAAGCNDYISKPFQAETLFLKLQEYLGLEYIYAEASPPLNEQQLQIPDTQVSATNLSDPNLLSTLPTEWLQSLEDAAVCGNDRAIAELATHLPTDFSPLGMQLTHLAQRYEFEQILKLMHGRGCSSAQTLP